jgi:2-haloacid dehalogenase
MRQTLGFDVYGTLVNPVDMGQHLSAMIGDQADAFGQLWHDKKVEYAFRKGLMQQYQDFGVCTLQALRYCMATFKIELSADEQQELMAKFSQLAAFSDVIDGLKILKAQGHQLVAFSNGPEAAVRKLLKNAAVLPYLDDVISVDDVQTYKPSPVVYQHLLTKTQSGKENCWMISSNPWDVIGGKAAGLKAAWIQRDPAKIFDPWGADPDIVVSNLIQLSQQLE